jgi:hypothetical protein
MIVISGMVALMAIGAPYVASKTSRKGEGTVLLFSSKSELFVTSGQTEYIRLKSALKGKMDVLLIPGRTVRESEGQIPPTYLR